MPMNRETLANIVAKLRQEIENDTLPHSLAKSFIMARHDDRPSARWSAGNRWIMLLNGTEDARGYRQWQDVGRWVKKGAKAFYILGPITRTIEVKGVDPETGQETVERRTILVGFTGIPVFRYEDTDGRPLERPDYRPAVMPPLAHLADAWGLRVTYQPSDGRFYGFYTWRPDGTETITLCTHEEDTWFHELAHAAHRRLLNGHLKGGQDSRQEMVAGLAAAILAELYGMRLKVRRNVEYAKAYANPDPVRALRTILGVLDEAERVVALILDEAQKATQNIVIAAA